MNDFENYRLSEEDEKKAIRIAKSIAKKFKELDDLGVGAIMAIGACTPSFAYYPKEIIKIMYDNGDINSDQGGCDNIDNYIDYQLSESSHKNISV